MSYVSPKQAAERFNVHTHLIYKEIAAGRIRAVRIGAPDSKRPVLRIPIAALEAWEAAQIGGEK
jgi:excisionase family DNA binding protein